ncbi:hypothetical protein BH10CHL1_BH10CHL1_48610 [soil metagenome]
MKRVSMTRFLRRYWVVALLVASCLSLGLITQVRAQPAENTHSMGVYAHNASSLTVTVDNVIVYDSVLLPGIWREWRGQRFTVAVGATDDVEFAIDHQVAGRLGRVSQVRQMQWPTNITAPSITTTKSIATSTITTVVTATNVISTNVISPNIPLTGATPTQITTGTVTAPTYYSVQAGDTLFVIAQQFNVAMDSLLKLNQIADANVIQVGMVLAIPGSDGALPDPSLRPQPAVISGTATISVPQRGTLIERMTVAAQKAATTSPFYKTTWLTYYGRPDTPIMGILGEYDLDKLTVLLKQAAKVYDQANGDQLGMMPAFHLVYGMATKAPGDDNSYLAFLSDEVVKAYVERAEQEHFAVILDVQIGALKPADAIKPALPWLSYKNVHLAIDPEFAMAHKGQAWPGDPIGFITAQQLNQVQATMQTYITEKKLEGPRILLVHQFQDDMIINKDQLDTSYPQIALTISADGWGDPWGKIGKYNAFVNKQTQFGAFKLFYKWDEPLMTERQTLGIDPYADNLYIEVTPNLIMYQ